MSEINGREFTQAAAQIRRCRQWRMAASKIPISRHPLDDRALNTSRFTADENDLEALCQLVQLLAHLYDGCHRQKGVNTMSTISPIAIPMIFRRIDRLIMLRPLQGTSAAPMFRVRALVPSGVVVCQ
jgi:hypothetical protein